MIAQATYSPARQLLDEVLVNILETLFLEISTLSVDFLLVAQSLCAIFMLLYFGMKGFEFISGDKKVEIIPLLRPFALSLVVIFWVEFINVINFPLTVVDNTAKGMYGSNLGEVDAVIVQRYLLMDSVANRVNEMAYEVEQASSQDGEESLASWFGLDMFDLSSRMKSLYIIVISKIKFMILQIVEFIVVTIFQMMTYLVYFIKIIFASIMVILGPFAFAISILPGFRDSYISWIARYISIALYTTIAHIILTITFVIVRYALETEIDLLEQMLGDDPQSQALFLAYITTSSIDINLFLIALLMGAISMLTIPVISTWVVNTSGAGAAIAVIAASASKGVGAASK